MAIRNQDKPPPPELMMPRADAESALRTRIEKGEDLKQRAIRTEDELEESKREYYRWFDYNTELLRRMFTTSEIADEYSLTFASGWYEGKPLAEFVKEFRDEIAYRLNRLASVLERLELIPLARAIPAPDRPKAASGVPASRKIFVVHGHDEGAREKVARFLGQLDFCPVILHEQPNAGRTIIEKFEDYSDVGFAVVLLTPDDVGAARAAAASLNPRARQNVMFELGFFIGRLGRQRVCALHTGGVELPSDINGVIYVDIDAGGAWRLLLAKELREAGFEVDLNKAM